MKTLFTILFLVLLPILSFSQNLVSINPISVNAGQTLNVTITGNNTHFNQGSATYIDFNFSGFNQASGTIFVNSINSISPTTLIANITIPSNTFTGNYNVDVYNNVDGYLTLSGFHVNGITPPTLNSITPNTANAGQTLNVTITGNNTHFNQGSYTSIGFNFNGFNQGSGTTYVNSVNAISPTTIIANVTIPSNTYSGNYNVDVYNNVDGYLTLSGFHVNGIIPPTLNSITPNMGNAGQTLNVTITGNNTHFNQGSGTMVNFGFNQGSATTNVNSINAISPTTLIANITIPTNTYTGNYDIDVYNSVDGYLSIGGFYVNGITPPSLNSIAPNIGSAGQTLNVTITGNNTHFNQGSGTFVDFGFNQGSGTTVVNSINTTSPTSMIANITIPSNTYTGTYNVGVYNSIDGYLTLSGFQVNGINPPTLSSISPNMGNAGQTLNVTITGNNTHFNQGSGTTVAFGFNQGSGTTVVNSINTTSSTSIIANITIPSNTYTGSYNVDVYNDIDGYLTLSGFQVNGITPPTLSSITPNMGNAGQTLNVTITGNNTHFNQGSGTTVAFGFDQGSGTTVVNSINTTSPTSMIANITIPSNTYTGTYTVDVYNSIDGYLALSGFQVNGINPPTLSSITPNMGNAGQTLNVTITGNNTHFDQGSGTTVDFGFNQGSGTTVVNSITTTSSTSMIANITIPSNTYTGTYTVDVYNSIDGYLTLSGFQVNGINPPTLDSITPNIGNAGQTLNVTITGNNTHFDQGSGTTVDFAFNQGSNTTVVNSINVINASTLVVNITIPQNTNYGIYDVSLYNSIDGYLIKPNSFEVHNNLNLSGFVISTNTSQNGACDGNATLVFTGGVAPYTYLYSNGSLNNTATNLCQGYYSVSVTDALGETLSIPFVIASPNTIFSNSTYQDSTIVDSVYNAAVSNCVINYSAIDSVYISNYTNLSNNFISVTWNVVSGTTSETVTVIYSLDASSGVYTLVLQLFCPNKSLNQLLKAYDQIYIDNSFSGLEKIEDNIISIYPNPFENNLTISIENDQATEVFLTDITGKTILNQKYTGRLIVLDLGDLSSGQYFVTIKNKNYLTTRKVIK
jgi:hypothetical protein